MTGWIVATALAIALAAALGVPWWALVLAVVICALIGAIVWLLGALSQSTSIWR